MSNFLVTFQLSSYYEDESLNLTNIIEEDFEADDLDSLFEIIDDPDNTDSIDDSSVINMDTDDSPYEVNIEYVLIKDESGSVLYKDDDYNPWKINDTKYSR